MPVFPIVVYLAPGTGGLGRGQYEQRLFGTDILTFRYGVVGLPDLFADDYLELENPLAALSAPEEAMFRQIVEQTDLQEEELNTLFDCVCEVNSLEETGWRQEE